MSTPAVMLSLLAPLALAEPGLSPATGGPVAFRVGVAETVSDGRIDHAVILVEEGKIVVVGQDLPIDRGIRVLDRPDWVVMPGLVNAYSRLGMDSRAGTEKTPHAMASDELLPRNRDYAGALEAGVTTLALYPAGNGIPGQAVAVRPSGDTRSDMIIEDGVYMKIRFRSNSKSKKMIREGFEKLDDFIEKEKKAREKFDKELAKAKKAKDKAKDKAKKDSKDKDKKDDSSVKAALAKPLPTYEAPEPDPEVVPFMQLREGELKALISISKAGDLLHLLDALDDEEISFDLRVPMTTSLDIFHVAERIGEAEYRVIVEPQLTLTPGTMRQRNLPEELSSAGAKIVFIPTSDTVSQFEVWMQKVGRLVAAGLPRDVALRAVTLEPAELIGLGERIGSISEGKDANLVFYDGDPFEVGTKVMAVMLEGQIVYGEEQ